MGLASRLAARARALRPALRRWSPAIAALAAAVVLVSLRLSQPAPFERARLAAFDTLQRLSPRVPAVPSRIAVVVVDEDSLARLGQWPWPRDVIAALVTALRGLDAAAIGFDMVFAEPDRIAAGAGDRALATALAGGRVVLGFGLLPRRQGGAPGRPPDIKAGFASIGADPLASVARFAGAVTNLPALEDAAEGLGSFTIVAGRDQMVRRLPLLQALGEQLVPSLALEALRVGLQADTVAVRARRAGAAHGRLIGYTLRLGEVSVPVDADGAIWLHHARSDPDAAIPAWRLLDPAARAGLRDSVAGRIVFIGASATGLVDLRATPLNPFEPGVNIIAGAVDQILSQRSLIRPPWAGAAELLASMALAALLGALVCRAGLPVAATATAAACALVLAAAWLAFRWGTLLDPTVALAASLLAFGVASPVRYLVAERDALRLRHAFAHYLAPQLVEQLVRDPRQLRLGGELRDMTFLFTDLEGFTALTETLGPEALVHLLNGYLDGLCGIAVAHGGTLDKIVGDALHVMFNAPVAQPDHAERAVRCALALDRFAMAFAAEQRARGIAFGRTRIGVNTGRAVVGNFGGSRRFDYTAHGDAINTAARLETANKHLGTRICVSRATVALVPPGTIAFRPGGTLLLRGKAGGVDVFEPLSPSDAALAWMAPYAEAFAQLSQGDAQGAAALLALHASHPGDALLALHARRIAEGHGLAPMAA